MAASCLLVNNLFEAQVNTKHTPPPPAASSLFVPDVLGMGPRRPNREGAMSQLGSIAGELEMCARLSWGNVRVCRNLVSQQHTWYSTEMVLLLGTH